MDEATTTSPPLGSHLAVEKAVPYHLRKMRPLSHVNPKDRPSSFPASLAKLPSQGQRKEMKGYILKFQKVCQHPSSSGYETLRL